MSPLINKKNISIASIIIYYFSATCFSWTQEEVTEIVERTALNSYQEINEKKLWFYPKPAESVSLETLHKDTGHAPFVGQWQVYVDWDHGVGEFAFRFVKNKDQSLTDALDDLVNHETAVDCMLAFNYVALRCLQALLGDEQLNLLCKNWEQEYRRSYEISDSFYTPLLQLFVDVHQCSMYSWKGRGGFGVIYNDPHYDKIEKFSYNRLLNLFQIGNDGQQEKLLMGFDPDFFALAITAKDAKNHLKKMFQEDGIGTNITWNKERFIAANDSNKCKVFTINACLINNYIKDQSYSTATTSNPYYLNHPRLEILGSTEKGWALVNWTLPKNPSPCASSPF